MSIITMTNSHHGLSALRAVALTSLLIGGLAGCCVPELTLDPDKAITAFNFTKASNPGLAADVAAIISESNKTIAWSFPSGTNIAAFVPTISVSDKATASPASGAATDFTNPVTYTVTAEDGSTQAYVATVTATFGIASPSASVYSSMPPMLTCTSSNTLLITLNGVEVTAANNEYLNSSVTGLNRLAVIELYAQGGIFNTVTIDYFLNNLTQADADSFVYGDGVIAPGTWNTWNAASYLTDLEVDAEAVAARGATDLSAWGLLGKSYVSATESKCIQAQDVVALAAQTAWTAIGYMGPTGNDGALLAQLGKTQTGYDLYITESSPSLIPSPFYVVVGNATLSAVTPGDSIRVYFYRNGTAYQAVSADPSGNILASINVSSYASVIDAAVGLTGRGITLAPYDTSGSTNILVKIDNYAYYK